MQAHLHEENEWSLLDKTNCRVELIRIEYSRQIMYKSLSDTLLIVTRKEVYDCIGTSIISIGMVNITFYYRKLRELSTL